MSFGREKTAWGGEKKGVAPKGKKEEMMIFSLDSLGSLFPFFFSCFGLLQLSPFLFFFLFRDLLGFASALACHKSSRFAGDKHQETRRPQWILTIIADTNMLEDDCYYFISSACLPPEGIAEIVPQSLTVNGGGAFEIFSFQRSCRSTDIDGPYRPHLMFYASSIDAAYDARRVLVS